MAFGAGIGGLLQVFLCAGQLLHSFRLLFEYLGVPGQPFDEGGDARDEQGRGGNHEPHGPQQRLDGHAQRRSCGCEQGRRNCGEGQPGGHAAECKGLRGDDAGAGHLRHDLFFSGGFAQFRDGSRPRFRQRFLIQCRYEQFVRHIRSCGSRRSKFLLAGKRLHDFVGPIGQHEAGHGDGKDVHILNDRRKHRGHRLQSFFKQAAEGFDGVAHRGPVQCLLCIINRQDDGLDAARNSSAHIVKRSAPACAGLFGRAGQGGKPGGAGGHGQVHRVDEVHSRELAVAHDLCDVRGGDADGVRIHLDGRDAGVQQHLHVLHGDVAFRLHLTERICYGAKGRVGAVAVECHGVAPGPHGLGRFGYLHTARREILHSPRRIVEAVCRAGHDLRGLRQRLIRGGNVAGHSRHNAGELLHGVDTAHGLVHRIGDHLEPFFQQFKDSQAGYKIVDFVRSGLEALGVQFGIKNQCAVICHLSVHFLPACLFHFAVYLFRAPPHPFLHILLHRPGTALFRCDQGFEFPVVFLLLHGFFHCTVLDL